MTTEQDQPVVLGWREWISLPELQIAAIKAKVDTGARSSSLHAIDIEPFDRGGVTFVKFIVEPVQRLRTPRIACEAPVVDQRTIRDSGGHTETRFVIATIIQYQNREKSIELTLTRRRGMLFRMLLGRTAMVPDIHVDPGSSFRLGKPDSNGRLPGVRHQ